MKALNLFARGDMVKHINGSQYLILSRCIIEATLQDCYAYLGEDGIVWVRPVEEMEDGRFVIVGSK